MSVSHDLLRRAWAISPASRLTTLGKRQFQLELANCTPMHVRGGANCWGAYQAISQLDQDVPAFSALNLATFEREGRREFARCLVRWQAANETFLFSQGRQKELCEIAGISMPFNMQYAPKRRPNPPRKPARQVEIAKLLQEGDLFLKGESSEVEAAVSIFIRRGTTQNSLRVNEQREIMHYRALLSKVGVSPQDLELCVSPNFAVKISELKQQLAFPTGITNFTTFGRASISKYVDPRGRFDLALSVLYPPSSPDTPQRSSERKRRTRWLIFGLLAVCCRWQVVTGDLKF